MKRYTHLTYDQRYQILSGLEKGYTYQIIADIVGVSISTISREVRRNRTVGCTARQPSGYLPCRAHHLAMERRAGKSRPRIGRDDWRLIEALLAEKWSPEQISLWLAKQGRLSVSTEWIYRYIHKDKAAGGGLYRHLRCCKKYRKHYASKAHKGTIPNRVSIERRPAVVERRSRIGDWELDTMYGKGNTASMLTMVDRASRYVRVDILPNRTARVIGAALVKNLAPIKDFVLTLTADNGKEFGNHEAVSGELGADFYFAHPYASWERGTNENTNGLIRQYFPKSCDFATITRPQLARAVNQLNNRPRKCLGMKTPNQVLFGIDPPVALRG